MSLRARRSSTPFVPKGKSLTKQSFGDPSDINAIVGKFLSSGTLDWYNRLEPRFGDFTGVEDYHSALNRVVEAQEAFDQLPARIRGYFANDPAELVAAAHDPSRAEELRGLGFVPLGEPAAPADPHLEEAAPEAGAPPPKPGDVSPSR